VQEPGSEGTAKRRVGHYTTTILVLPVNRYDFNRMNAQEDFSNLYTSSPVSFADTYPDVPAPDPPLSPHLLAPRWQSHDLYGEDMPRIAADLLEAGHDTPSLRRLAGEMNVVSSRDMEPLLAQMFRELGVRYPINQSEANLIVSRQVAREVIAGLRNAWAAANHLEIAIWGWTARNPLLQTIFEINDEIDWDPGYGRSMPALKSELLDSFASLATLTDHEIAQ
jgi:hypothetical protein